ncbi:hypothetical protein F5Y16DRAFT_274136 [Xylariaceae sp. FL0255]|nr:hypothetical protein F5Y16DRAFT_274136 [Xylariaceae sp. FL0255]
MYTPPPVPPPKPSSHDVSRLGTPTTTHTNSPRPPPPVPDSAGLENADASGLIPAQSQTPGGGMGGGVGLRLQQQIQQQAPIPDPGDSWIPAILEDKSKQDLQEILSNPVLLNALTLSPDSIHPSLAQSQQTLQLALAENISLAQHLNEVENRLSHQREATQAQLLAAHALERQWRAKQGETDTALAGFAPAALYGRLTASLGEQEALCRALEESFLEGGGGGLGMAEGDVVTERETLDWVRRYREARRLFYLRQERKERWNERRVGGWR